MVSRLLLVNDLEKEEMANQIVGGPTEMHHKTQCLVSVNLCVFTWTWRGPT